MAPGANRTVTVAEMAAILSVRVNALRRLYHRGIIGAPQKRPPSKLLAWSQPEALRIATWWLRRAADGGSRGVGASYRKARAEALLAQLAIEETLLSMDASYHKMRATDILNWLHLGGPTP